MVFQFYTRIIFLQKTETKRFEEPLNEEYLISGIHKTVETFPKRDLGSLNWKAIQIREWYPRAYEYWTIEEEMLLKNVAVKIPCKFKLSDLFKRQPSAIEKRLELILH